MRMHDRKELQRLYVSAALLVAPAVLAATGEAIGGADLDSAEGETYDSQLSSSIRDIVAYGGSRPDFNAGGSVSAKVWASSISCKFQKHLLARIDHLHNLLPIADRKRAQARIKSCSGVGAQWVAALPTSPKTMLQDDEFQINMRFRVGLATNSLEFCPHVSSEGVQCDSECDAFGYHLEQCPSGGGYFVGHDTVCAEVADLVGGAEGIPGVVVDWKAQVEAWPRATRGYEADVGLFHIPGERDVYLDGVLSLANPRTYPGCENKAGKVAELWARRKNASHPVFDRQTGQRLQPFDFRALAFERHGFFAKETKSFIQKLARMKAAFYELDPSEKTRKWYPVISCCIQRANARILSGDPTPGRRNPPPRSLLTGVRDFAPCGA